jgi:hypothetical protein
MPFCGCNEYDNSGFSSVFSMLAHIHRLGREIVSRHGPLPVKVYIYGAGAPGWLTEKVFSEIEGIRVRGFFDRQKWRAERTVFGIPVLLERGNVCSLDQDKPPADAQVVVAAVNPGAFADVAATIQRKLPEVNIYYLHEHPEARRIISAKTPFVIASPGRSASTWLGKVIRHLAIQDGYSPEPYREVTTRGTTVHEEALSRLKPGRYVSGLEHFSDRLVEPVRTGRVRAAYLLRDPRDVQVSLSFYRHGRFVFDLADLLYPVHQAALWRTLPEVHFVRFEELVATPVPVLLDLCAALGIEAQRDFVEQVVLLHDFNILAGGRKPGQEQATHHYRKGVSGDWVNHYDDTTKKEAKKYCGQALVDLGYEQDLSW